MGCLPLIPVPIHPSTHCLGDTRSSIPTKSDLGMPSLAHVCCTLVRMVAMVSKEKGQLEPGVRDVSRAAWSARAGAGGLGRAGIDVWRRGRWGHTVPHFAPHKHPSPPHCMLTFIPGAVWLAVAQGSLQPSLPSAGLQGLCLPASLCPHRAPCLAVTLPCAVACTGLS